mmetsp:Transcript_14016/g.28660  ORF Transcript_14016/g.28660 Transcript_14016/m.28660 type:complete len:88 (-) Transcript_14016:845-1108(-)
MGHFFMGEPDILNVGLNRYMGNFGKSSGPNNVEVAAGEVITWGSSNGNQGRGFEICEPTVFVGNLATRIVGFLLLPFYLLVPIAYLC